MLGGLGFPVPEGVDPKFSEFQRTLAYDLLMISKQEFYGEPSQQPNKPFTYLTTRGSTSKSLGQKPGLVRTRLGSPNGPYLIGESVFRDDSTIKATPLAMAYGDLDESVLEPDCRLSFIEMERLYKGSYHQRTEMLNLSEMISFPFSIIQYDIDNSVIPTEEDLVKPIIENDESWLEQEMKIPLFSNLSSSLDPTPLELTKVKLERQRALEISNEFKAKAEKSKKIKELHKERARMFSTLNKRG